uniref:Protein kinase domain-containing protein n=1 Tax=Leersia perrieri TaxID=77586 RepID=A0A0D9XSY8_9ORYZ
MSSICLLLTGLINEEDVQLMESLTLDLSTLKAVTNNFDECNKLGEGGFGVVYKGTLPNGQVIAVKRLSHTSQQGINELTNESFNWETSTQEPYQDRSNVLDWERRFKIISEIARGLQYMHEESRLKIIHRDLKANNILLDSDLSPKISDFGLAKLYGGDQSHVITNRVAGTYGYVAAEYAMCGQYSVKSDVFSFGVIVLEIVTGRRSMGSYKYEQSVSLLGLIWQHWSMGTAVGLVDPSLLRNISSSQQSSDRDQMLRCIHIGLLCVQENPADRPKLSSVIEMLRSSSTTPLQAPSRPGFWVHSVDAPPCSSSSGRDPAAASANHVSVTELEARILWNHRDGKYTKRGT